MKSTSKAVLNLEAQRVTQTSTDILFLEKMSFMFPFYPSLSWQTLNIRAEIKIHRIHRFQGACPWLFCWGLCCKHYQEEAGCMHQDSSHIGNTYTHVTNFQDPVLAHPFCPFTWKKDSTQKTGHWEHSPSTHMYRYCKVTHAFTIYTCIHSYTCMHIYTCAHCSPCLSASTLQLSARAVLKGVTFIPFPSQIKLPTNLGSLFWKTN